MFEIELKWSRAYCGDGTPAYTVSRGCVRQVGTKRDPIFPLEYRKLYLDFANLDETPEACSAFASRWGFLTINPILAEPGASEPLEMWRKEIRRLKWWSRSLPQSMSSQDDFHVRHPHIKSTSHIRITHLDVWLRTGVERPVLVLQPPTLIAAMHLQMARTIAGVNEIPACRNCGKLFERGGARGEKTRRSISIFCTEQCKNQFHYKRRAGK